MIPFVTKLDLPSNSFAGEILASIGNCMYINDQLLNNNQLTGKIPVTLGKLAWIRTFSVANNLLEGPVPQFANIDIVGMESYENNRALCGGPFGHCKKLKGGDKFLDVDDFLVGFSAGYYTFLSAFMISATFKWKLKLAGASR